jgi:hypothetical protein
MDAPTLPSASLPVLASQDEIAAIHPACVCDAKSRGPDGIHWLTPKYFFELLKFPRGFQA